MRKRERSLRYDSMCFKDCGGNIHVVWRKSKYSAIACGYVELNPDHANKRTNKRTEDDDETDRKTAA